MALADDIEALRDRTVAELVAAHDYFADTQTAWEIVTKVVATGTTFAIPNNTTGTITTQADLVAKARGYVAEQLTQATFQQFIAIFDVMCGITKSFFFGAAIAVVSCHQGFHCGAGAEGGNAVADRGVAVQPARTRTRAEAACAALAAICL